MTSTEPRGHSLIELLVAIAIIAILLALASVGVGYSREASRRAQCQNNLRQMSLGLSQFVETHKQLPEPPPPGMAGGWCVALLSFAEEPALADALSQNPSLDPQSMSPLLRARPAVLTCPSGSDVPSDAAGVPVTHYVLSPSKQRRPPNLSYSILDASPSDTRPWPTGPEGPLVTPMSRTPAGPHSGGYNVVYYNGKYDSGVRLLVPGGADDTSDF